MSDIHEGLDKLGYVVGEASPTYFYFIVDEGKYPPRWEYVVVRSLENVDGNDVEVMVVAQICEVLSSSLALDLSSKPRHEAVERIVKAGLVDRRIIAKARVLGFNYNGEVLQPRRAVHPGNEVYRAPSSILKEFYSYPDSESLHIGSLINRVDVPVSISIRGFRRHLAILAQTGAGKSYAAGVLLEELLKKGATAIVLDPHADHVFLSRSRSGGFYSKRVTVFRTLESSGRYNATDIGYISIYEVKFSDLSLDEIQTICGIEDKWTNIISAIGDALKKVRELKGDSYGLEDLIEILESNSDDRNYLRALKYVRKLQRIRVFGDATTNILNILKPKHISIIDLSGLDDEVSDYIAYRILNDTFNAVRLQKYPYPVFIVIEEAHRFVPNKESTLSKSIIKRIAAEGRKFGLFLIIISQRPSKIDPDVLSQCNSQIILRITNPGDQEAVRASSERMSEDLLRDLPGLNVGEAVIVGEVVKAPVMVRIRPRETMEGGADIDVISKLAEASREAEESEKRLLERVDEERKHIKELIEG
ncbi:MAG: ATP-binding protein [archaeon YNP-WB-040]|nr:ATP-binding protein [Candidatus Culexarchaeum yellowstonense]